ncbi:tRNA (guanine-N1)-methyltransferase [Lentiprolixibacter aurantiacus]|uniref:tRNA (Guanine-N1)-methyltransferase n=1 Tax=Lentiprolixibacter aurantiacus TaxID=2993939 RepID=A0AAE3ML20_9FLAO|nr:tRNA (guanine-N1)-methyltransferase [Lentiprolixibacter aurantiacus]MCX2719353.1 tRNA (guanine-N1)-methyltransferase [Lentiprolixibacter aurantiacus]
MNKFRIILLALGLLFCNMQFAQDAAQNDEPSLDKGTIDSQFEFVYKKSGNYRADGKRYEVVRTLNLDKLRQNVRDTINAFNKNKAELKATISGNEATIASLNDKLEQTTGNLNRVTEEKDSMSFFGMLVSKSSYNLIMWTVIIVLFLMLLLFIYRYRNSNYLTQEAKVRLAELEQEYEDHRRRALEREQRISRQLQDEILKYKKSK